MATILFDGKSNPALTSPRGYSANGYGLGVVVTLQSQDIPNNTSTLLYQVYMETLNNSWGWSGFSSPRAYIKRDGTQVDSEVISSLPTNNRYNWIKVCEYEEIITHNPDGTKKITIVGEYKSNVTSYSYLPKDFSQSSGELTLPTIPRASSFTVTNADIGGKSTISINRASETFTHTLSYKLDGQNTFTQIASGVGNGYEWTIPTSFYELIGKPKTCTIRCQTYSGSTAIGSAVDKNITITANESECRPVINSAVLTDINTTTSGLTEDNTKLVNYKSTAQIVLSASLRNYATLKSLVINGEAVTPTTSVSGGTTTVSYTYSKTNFSGNLIPIVLTDSRDYTNVYFAFQSTNSEGENYFELIPYVSLTIRPDFKRLNRTDGTLGVSHTGNFYIGSFKTGTPNTLALSWKVREKGTSAWTNGSTAITPTISQSENTFTSGTTPIELTNPITGSEGLFDYKKNYEFVIDYTDLIDNLETQVQLVTKGQWNFAIFKDAIMMEDDVLFNIVDGEVKINKNLEIGNTGKILENISDIQDNLTSTDTNKPLSANQGRIINLGFSHAGVIDGSFNNVGVGQALQRSGLYSIASDSVWYNLINIRHRNGESDGTSYGLQLRSIMTDTTSKIQFRKQSGSWGSWSTLANETNIISNSVTATNEYIDGRRVYIKRFVFTTTINNPSYTFAHGISGFHEIWVDKSNSYIYAVDGRRYTFPIVFYNTAGTSVSDGLDVCIYGGNVIIYVYSGWGTNWTKVITVKYTV